MRAGKMHHRITFQSPTMSKSVTGADVVTWVDIQSTFARIVPSQGMRGMEFLAADKFAVQTTYDIDIRYMPGINEAMRIRWDTQGDRILNILRITDTGAHARSLSITAEEQR